MTVLRADGTAATSVAAAATHAGEPFRLLRVTDLYRHCRTADLPFRTTAEVPDVDDIVGQDRAVHAIELAITTPSGGFNVFALGPPGIGKTTAIRQFLARRAASVPTPDDWCYVHNFADPPRPQAIRLPAGTGAVLRESMAQLCVELRGAIPAAFESDSYRRRKEAIESEIEGRQAAGLATLEKDAQAAGVALVRTPVGLGFAPTRDGEVLAPEDFQQLPEPDQQRLRRETSRLESKLQEMLHQLPQWQRETRRRLRELDRDVVQTAVDHLVDELRHRFADLPSVVEYVDRVERDVIDAAPEFLAALAQAEAGPEASGTKSPDGGLFRRYRVNVLVQHDRGAGAPIVFEDHPTYANLVGRTEYIAQLGTLVTDFSLIRAGALHQANGGFLVLEADKVLLEPYAWDQLKRALRSGEVRVEPLAQSLGLLTTATLDPEPIPLDVKVALIGDRRLYYLLCAYDHEFPELFKVAADFDDDLAWTPANARRYAGLIATIARRESLRPFTAAAVGRTIESLARVAEDGTKLSTHMGRLADLLRESDHWAGQRSRAVVTRSDVQRAIDARILRSSRVYERLQEETRRSTIRIDVSGVQVGQVNALSVLQLGQERFGHPSRVTATARVGRGEVVDIEREVELGGPIHSKGVLILSGFLGGRFGSVPLALRASLVFEQSYGAIEGDSASLAELCALLSAIGGFPIRQDFAMTGSVDQRGLAQAIGGVNEKIEGYLDTCAARGLSGSQGVIIPEANVPHLMLAARVRRAVRARQFSVFAVSSVDGALELLSGLPAGAADATGAYPPESVNGRVQAGLRRLADTARQFSSGPGDGGTPGNGVGQPG